MTKKQQYLNWLNDALAMELDITKMLEAQRDDMKDTPKAQSMVEDHLEKTRRHAELVRECIENNGGSVSTVKSFFATLAGSVKGATADMNQDVLVKHALANYATEHFEMATYRGLIVAAEEVGDDKSVFIFEEIMQDEEEMAKKIEESMPQLVKKYLQDLQ